MSKPPSILVTNDDGVHAPALRALAQALAALGEVTTVAPLREMSACSRSISLFRPVRYEEVAPGCYGVDGTPVDAVVLALNHLLAEKPSLVVSGINQGANLGMNVFYSGTVGAAVEGTLHGIPSIAVSICSKRTVPFGPAAGFAAELAKRVLEEGLAPGVTLNVNVPGDWKSGVRLTQLAHRRARRFALEPDESREPQSFSIREVIDASQLGADSDYTAISNGAISITPLTLDGGDPLALAQLERWIRDFLSPPISS
ncbi:MAG: 5'/3'-nucleotidase SurE [Terriglobia bacterium]